MTDHKTPFLVDARADRAAERRRFLKFAGGTAFATGTLSLLAACSGGGSSSPTPSPSPSPSSTASPTPTPSPTPTYAEADALNFALNLAYLEATFYAFAAFGADLPAAQTTGTGTPGTVTGGRQATFADPVNAQYCREIANDKIAHVAYLRSVLGDGAVARAAVNIDVADSGAFTAFARAAGIVSSTATFDAYGSDDNVLLAGFIFSDLVVTAYRGLISSIRQTSVLEAMAGIMAIHSYHAGLIRTLLVARGGATAALLTGSTNISNTRDQLDGGVDLDQPLTGTDTVSNIMPTDSTGLVFPRSAAQALNILFLDRAAVTSGCFFPAGINGTLNTSAANNT